jgi:hypothetical protein
MILSLEDLGECLDHRPDRIKGTTENTDTEAGMTYTEQRRGVSDRAIYTLR